MTATDDTRRRAAESTPVVTVTDLEHGYDGLCVLDGVSLSVPTDAVTALVGPNGSGKSTLLRLVTGVQAPQSGTITLPDADAPRTVGYLPQSLRPRDGFTVRQTVETYAALVDGGPGTDDVLSTVGLDEVTDERVDALSGGMRRLLGVAIALVGDPPVLVLDEPTSGLDPAMTARVFDVLSDLAAAGRGVLVASHDLDAVGTNADRVVLLDQGTVQAQGPAATVLADLDVRSLSDAFETTVADDAGVTVRHGV
ncbi:ABC transporter ATP-binding protein [Halorientalis brevis]|uniref:ABC transporter ATP-binding protein n=1 Tax=Halorientalis brevis TaxID=1126241 RepID=A0ABD6CEY0_9EURY|nr:ABC transporter ATP-binding protein [Halorientalis brevis]